MKKLVLAALAIAAMAACTKSNVQYEQPGEISLQPVAQKATKAAVDGTTYPTSLNFNVWAWWGNKPNGSTFDGLDYSAFQKEYIVEGTFVSRGNGSWGGQTPYYWPTSGSLVFAGYSPADAIGEFEYSLSSSPQFTVTEYVQSLEIENAKDLMWFDVDKSYLNNPGGSEGSAEGVPVVFKHALSWLTFKFNLQTETTEKRWKIKSVELTGIENKGNFIAVMNGTTEWKNVQEDKTNQNTISVVLQEPYLVEYVQDGTVLPGTDVLVENNIRNNAVLVIPQSCASTDAKLVITYDMTTYATVGDDAVVLEGQIVELPLNGQQITDGKWLPGMHYTYTITFGGNEILIAPSVTKWADETPVVNIPVQ